MDLTYNVKFKKPNTKEYKMHDSIFIKSKKQEGNYVVKHHDRGILENVRFSLEKGALGNFQCAVNVLVLDVGAEYTRMLSLEKIQ